MNGRHPLAVRQGQSEVSPRRSGQPQQEMPAIVGGAHGGVPGGAVDIDGVVAGPVAHVVDRCLFLVLRGGDMGDYKVGAGHLCDLQRDRAGETAPEGAELIDDDGQRGRHGGEITDDVGMQVDRRRR